MGKLGKIVKQSKDVLDTEVGILVYDNMPVTYVILTFVDHYVVYLYDDDRDILVKGESEDLETAKDFAVSRLLQEINIH